MGQTAANYVIRRTFQGKVAYFRGTLPKAQQSYRGEAVWGTLSEAVVFGIREEADYILSLISGGRVLRQHADERLGVSQ